MNDKIVFSIIMPFYNSESYVKDAVLSIINQTFTNWELLAVNDGSTDSGTEIVKSFNDKRIKVINKKNGGYQSAVNCGLDHATGEYVIFLGSDDQLFPNILNDIYNDIEKNDSDIIAFNTTKFIKETGKKEIDVVTNYSQNFSFEGSLVDLEKSFPNYFYIHYARDSSKCYKRNIIGETRYFGKHGVCSDNAFSVLVALKSTKFRYLASDGYLWTVRKTSLANRKLSKHNYKDILFIWSSFYKAVLKNYDRSNIPNLLVNDYLHLFHVNLVNYGSYFFKNLFAYYKFLSSYLRSYKKIKMKRLSAKYVLRLSLPWFFSKVLMVAKKKTNK